MTHNQPLPPTPKFNTGYYLVLDCTLIKINGIIYDKLTNQWCYEVQIVADKTKSFDVNRTYSPTLEDFERLSILGSNIEKIDKESNVQSLEILFSATEHQSTWEASINDDSNSDLNITHVSEAYEDENV